MPTPTLRTDGRWMLQLPRAAGTSRRCVYGRTKDECIQRYQKALSAGSSRVRPGSISEFYATQFDGWIRSRVQPETVDRYDSEWLAMVGPSFGHLTFAELTPAIVQSAFTASPRSASSKTNARGLLLQIVRLAVATGLADASAETSVRICTVPSPKPKGRRDVVSAANALLAAASNAGHWIAGPLYASIVLGLRKGEIAGLKRTDIQGNVLTVSRQRNHTRGEKDRLKSRADGQTRRIALPESIAERLISSWDGSSIYLFTTDKGKPIPYQHLDRAMREFQDPTNPVTFHDFRAAAICNLIDAGVSDHTIMDLVGHSSLLMIRQYRDSSDDRIRAALKSANPLTDVQ